MKAHRAGAPARWLVLWALLGVGLAPSPVAAAEVSSSQLEQLAADAADGDGAALAALDGVTSVDGRPAAPLVAIEDAQGADLESRLRELAAAVRESGAATPGDVDAVAQAKQDAADAGKSGGDGWGGISLGLPPPLAILVLAGVLAGGLVAARAIGRQRVLEVATAASREGAVGQEGSPGALERRAKAAEKSGDFATAIRLRFAAGLLRLDDLGAVRLRPSLTPSAAAREAGSSTLRELAATYSRVLYGGHAAGEAEARAARTGWPAALLEARQNR